jgi:chromate transporter
MDSSDSNRPTALKMFTISLKIGMFSFGGGLSGWIFRDFTAKNKWVDEGSFLTDMAAARILPGPNSANILILLGYRLLGPRGALAGLAGRMIGPFSLLMGIFWLYDRFQGPAIDAALQGAAAGAIGPIVYMSTRSVRHSGRKWYGALIIAFTAIASFLKLPLLLIVGVALCVSFILVQLFGPADAV